MNSFRAVLVAAALFAAVTAGTGVLARQAPRVRAGAGEAAARFDSRFSAPQSGFGAVLHDYVAAARVSTGADEASHAPSDLKSLVAGTIVKTLPVTKDCMVLAYLPDWNHGNVDNIGVENGGGGVRTLLDWADPSADDLARKDRRYLLAVYSRKTQLRRPVGPLLAFEIREEWPERTSWKTMPAYAEDPALSLELAAGDGWKLLDITSLIRSRVEHQGPARGVLLRFLNEDHKPSRETEGVKAPEQTFSGYQLVSREGEGEWAERRPVVLIVDPPAAQ